MSGIFSGAALIGNWIQAIPLAAQLLGKVSNPIIVDATPPNLDPYATSLGQPGISKPSAGPGPSVKSLFPPNPASASSPSSIQVNTYGQNAFKTHLSGTISYPPEQGPVYTRKAKTDPFAVLQQPNNSVYPGAV